MAAHTKLNPSSDSSSITHEIPPDLSEGLIEQVLGAIRPMLNSRPEVAVSALAQMLKSLLRDFDAELRNVHGQSAQFDPRCCLLDVATRLFEFAQAISASDIESTVRALEVAPETDSQLPVMEDEMNSLTLDPSQEKVLRGQTGEVLVRNSAGEPIGIMLLHDWSLKEEPIRLTPDELDELAKRMSDPNPVWYTTEEVLEHLRSLDAR